MRRLPGGSGDPLDPHLPARRERPRPADGVDAWSGQGPPGSADPRLPLTHYLRILRDRWRIVAASFLVVTAAVAVGVAITPPVYRAVGTIEIRKQATEVVPVDALFQFERISEQYLQTEYGTLRSRALVQRVLAEPRLGGRLRAAFGDGASGAPEGLGAPAGAASLVEAVSQRLLVNPLVGSRIVRVGFDSPDAELSADVVNALVENYVQMRRAAGAAALVRLAEQADSVRTRLLGAEGELQAYVRGSGLAPVIGGGAAGESVPQERLRRLQQELTEAEAEGYRAAAVASVASDDAAAAESDLLRSLRVRMAELEGELAQSRATFTDDYPRVLRLRTELARLDSMVDAEQQRVGGAMRSQERAALHRRDLLVAAVEEQRRIVDAFAVSLAEYDRRRRDVESLKQLHGVLQQKRREAALSASLSSMDIAVLDAATPPLEPLRPRPKRDLALAAVTGLLLGLGLAFLREYTDGTVRRPEEIGGFGAVPLLAAIPTAPPLPSGPGRWSARAPDAIGAGEWPRIDGGVPPDSPLAEAFRGLRTSVLFGAGGALPRTLLVTSSSPGEGKTTVAANFAISLATLGHRVLLVDADMRRPSLHRVFGVGGAPGLADHLEQRLAFRHASPREVSPNLDLLPAGRSRVSPSDLLSDGRVHGWLAEAAAEYDFVVLDGPALHIHAPDARILTHAAGGVLLVVRSGSTSRDAVRNTMAQTPNLVGVVLNQLSPRRLPASYGPEAGGAYAQAFPGAETFGSGRSLVHGSGEAGTGG